MERKCTPDDLQDINEAVQAMSKELSRLQTHPVTAMTALIYLLVYTARNRGFSKEDLISAVHKHLIDIDL